LTYPTLPSSSGDAPIIKPKKEGLSPEALRPRLAEFASKFNFTYDPQATAPATYFDYNDTGTIWGNLSTGPQGAQFNIAGIQSQNVYVPGYYSGQKPILGHPPIMTADVFRKRYIIGLDQYLQTIPDFEDFFTYYLDVAVGTLEERLGLLLYPRVVITDAVERGFIPGVDFDFEVREQDFIAQDFFNWGWMLLQYGPVMQIQSLNMVYPTGQEILDIPMSWIKPMPLSRQIRIVPPQGALSQVVLGPGGFLVTLIGGMLQDFPALFFTDYTVGIWPFPQQIVHAVAMQVAIYVFQILSDVVSQGTREYQANVGNLRMMKRFSDPDHTKGAGQAFEPRIREYRAEIDRILTDFQKSFFDANQMFVV